MSEWRYKPVVRKMTILESICHFIRTFKWMTADVTYQLLMEGDDGYEDAPFSHSVVFVGETLTIESRKR